MKHYGASPIHLLAHLILLPLAGWALLTVLDFRAASNVVLWLVGAVILHDLVLLPAYSALDRGLAGVCGRVPAGRPSPLNHFRVPAVMSGVLLLAYFPPILGRNEMTFAKVAGYSPAGYAGRWAIVTVALFAISAIVYAVSAARSPGDDHRES